MRKKNTFVYMKKKTEFFLLCSLRPRGGGGGGLKALADMITKIKFFLDGFPNILCAFLLELILSKDRYEIFFFLQMFVCRKNLHLYTGETFFTNISIFNAFSKGSNLEKRLIFLLFLEIAQQVPIKVF